MARAEVVWEDQLGASRGTLARIEDTSRSGACIRVPIPIGVGARLKVKWHREEFSGIAKYCRRDGGDYILGIQREPPQNEIRTTELVHQSTTTIAVPPTANAQEPAAQAQEVVHELPKAGPEPAPVPQPPSIPASPIAPPAAVEPVPKVANEIGAANKGAPVVDSNPALLQESNTERRNQLHAPKPSPGQERTIVLNRLLHRDSGRQPQNASEAKSGNMKAQVSSAEAKPSRESQMTAKAKATGVPPNQGSLLPLEDIYTAVGIMNSKLGYNIDSVSAMLDSAHMKGMTSEVKRASILMALEAAGIPVGDLLQDAAKRLDALNAYEANERKRFEEYEARKTQESAQIQMEIERMTAHCLERIKHNLGDVTIAKDAFLNWQTAKQKEAQRISDAVALLTKPPAAEPPSESKPMLQTVGSEAKP